MKTWQNPLDRNRARLLLALPLLLSLGCRSTQERAPEPRRILPSSPEIHELLAKRMERNGVGVVVGVIDASGRRVVAQGRTGAPDGRALDGETVFQIGSVTKGITTLLLADMVVRGEVGLDDPVSRYLPAGVTMPQRGRPITLRDLATHMSGLPAMPANFDLAGQPDPYEAYTVEELYEFLSSYTPERAPGEGFEYSNLGVSILGRLLGNRMGMEYEALLERRVLQPLGMGSTSIHLSADQERRLAPGHDRYLEPVHTWEMATLQASGSLRSTANDLLNLVAAYLGYEKTPLAAAMELQLREGLQLEGRFQALGWGIAADGVVRHSGGKQGYRSAVAFDREAGMGVVVLANARTDDQPMDLALHLVSGEPLDPAPPAPVKPRIDVHQAELDAYAGSFRFEDGEVFEVVRNASHLLVRYPSGAILEFFPTAPREFFYIAGNDEITFEVDGEGRVTGLVLYGDGKDAGGGAVARPAGEGAAGR